MKKYEMTGITINKTNAGVKTGVLHRIRALKEFELIDGTIVHAGDLGGYVERESNLSQGGRSWILDNATVIEKGVVECNAIVKNNAAVLRKGFVGDDAIVCDYSIVTDYANVFGKSKIGGSSWIVNRSVVTDNSRVYGWSIIDGSSRIYENAIICNTRIIGDADIRGNALITNQNYYLTIGPIGSRSKTTTFFKDAKGAIYVSCGCFYGTIDEFLKAVMDTHGNNKYAKAYRAAAEAAIAQMCIDESYAPDLLQKQFTI